MVELIFAVAEIIVGLLVGVSGPTSTDAPKPVEMNPPAYEQTVETTEAR